MSLVDVLTIRQHWEQNRAHERLCQKYSQKLGVFLSEATCAFGKTWEVKYTSAYLKFALIVSDFCFWGHLWRLLVVSTGKHSFYGLRSRGGGASSGWAAAVVVVVVWIAVWITIGPLVVWEVRVAVGVVAGSPVVVGVAVIVSFWRGWATVSVVIRHLVSWFGTFAVSQKLHFYEPTGFQTYHPFKKQSCLLKQANKK